MMTYKVAELSKGRWTTTCYDHEGKMIQTAIIKAFTTEVDALHNAFGRAAKMALLQKEVMAVSIEHNGRTFYINASEDQQKLCGKRCADLQARMERQISRIKQCVEDFNGQEA